MLRIIQSRAGGAAKSYFSKSDYLSEGQEQPGVWGGKTAALLGLSGRVGKPEFDRLCDNLHPKSGEPLTQRTRFDRTVGYDFNFHSPKGVSVAYALFQDERIREAFERSVEETMSEAERDASVRVRRESENAERDTGNLVWASFTHLTARPIDGYPDMHLHRHCFCFNVSWDEEERCFKAAQFREIKRDAPYLEAAFHARFSRRMAELGYTIERTGRSWDIAEVPQSVRDKFSRRSAEIDDVAEAKGIVDPAEKDRLGAATRESKRSDLTMNQLREVWRKQLDDQEVADMSAFAERAPSEVLARSGAEAPALAQAILHCFERQSVIPLRTLLAESLRRGLGRVGVEEIHDAARNSDLVIRKFRGRTMVTTPEVLAEEQAMIDFVRSGKNASRPLNAKWRIQQEWLNDEQKAAVRHLLTSKDRVMLVRGGAGTGKTSLMREAVTAVEAGGHHVRTFAPSAQASRGVLQAEGFADATTVAELLVSTELQASAHGQVIWIDEAGLLSAKAMKEVFDLADRINARIILSGDSGQHGSVERGAVLSLLEQEAGLRPAEVRIIQRQKEIYRDAVQAIAAGDIASGINKLDRLGWVKKLSDSERAAAVAKEFADSEASGNATLVVSPTHREGQQIGQAIRRELRRREALAKDEVSLAQLVPLHLTEAERRDAAFLRKGDVIVFHQNVKGHKKGERVLVSEQVSSELLGQAKAFGVFRAAELPLAAGERIRFTANGKTADGKHRLFNGSVHTVKGFSERGDMKLGNGWVVSRDYGFLDHGYVVTSHAAQGRTVDHVILAESSVSFPAASREQFYVSASRGRKKCTIFTDDAQGLRDAVSDSSRKLTAWDLLRAERSRRSRQQANIVTAREPSAERGVVMHGR